MSIRRLCADWANFWLRSESPLGISLFRIVFGLIVLEWCLLLYPDLFNWFGMRGITSVQCSQQVLQALGPPGLNILSWMPPTDASIAIVFWLTTVAGIFLTLGLCTRMSALAVYLGVAAFQQQNCLIMNGGDILLKMTAFYLIFAASGNCLSLDSWFKRRRDPAQPPASNPVSGWPQQLFRFLIALIYFQAFWSKLEDPNWLNGSAIYFVLREHEFLRFPVAWIADSVWMCQTLTWGTLVIEGSMWALIWFKETRYWVLGGAVLLHLGIEYTMNLPVFESLMLAALIVFVPSNDLNFLFNRLRAAFAKADSTDSTILQAQSGHSVGTGVAGGVSTGMGVDTGVAGGVSTGMVVDTGVVGRTSPGAG